MNQRKQSNQSILTLVEEMRSGKITAAASKKEIEKIEKMYDCPFLVTSFTKKDKPWDKHYLNDLANAVMFGKTSKEYLLHIAEVSDDLYRPIRYLKFVLVIIVLLASGIGGLLLILAN